MRCGGCAVVGCTTTLAAILDLADAMAFANPTGLYALAPRLRRELDRYWRELRERSTRSP